MWPSAHVGTPVVLRLGAGRTSGYGVLATDGSQIDADNHGIARCLLINIGWAVITSCSEQAAPG